jgi:hypothetical protein
VVIFHGDSVSDDDAFHNHDDDGDVYDDLIKTNKQ